jgi:hypothetical protein
MKKTGKKFKHTAATPPTLVRMNVGAGQDFQIMNLVSIDALIGGWADEEHLRHIHDLCNTVILVGHRKGDANAIAGGRLVRAVVKSAVARHQKHGKYGINGDELKVLRDFMAFVPGFYARTSGAAVTEAELSVSAIFAAAVDQLRQQQREAA